jgi:glutamate dehydrogenase/leucine dehydrogenase
VPVADLITGYGLAMSIIRLYERQGRPLAGARVLLEGFGAVGGPCALYLARAGARLVGVMDREKALLEPHGLDAAAVEELLRRRENKLLPAADARCRYGAEADAFWDAPAEIFVSAAASGTLDERRLARLERAGVETIACGANQPFREAKLGATRVQRLADGRFTIVPDVIANCGMARAFSFLMQQPFDSDPTPLFHAVDDTIHSALNEIDQRNDGRRTGLLAATFGYALDMLHDV